MAEVRFSAFGHYITISPPDFDLKGLIKSVKGLKATLIKRSCSKARWQSNDIPKLVRVIKSHNDQISEDRTYLGIGLDASRRSSGPITTESEIKLKWKFDVAEVLGTELVERGRIVGPLATPQVDRDTVYFNTGPVIIALDRKTGKFKWKSDYRQVATQAQRLLAEKFPDQYDFQEIVNYTRETGEFAPICVFDDFVITGDDSSAAVLDTQEVMQQEYFDSRPQRNHAPVLGASWGITNKERHWLRSNIFILDKRTGQLLSVNRYSDSGEEEAQGYCNVQCAMRMATAYRDPETFKIHIVVGCSIKKASLPYTVYDLPRHPADTDVVVRISNGKLNGNRLTQKGGRLTKYVLDESTFSLDEVWRYYPTPRMLFAGDINPVTGQVFQSDWEAEEYNYHFDGVWGMRPTIDVKRNQVIFGTANGRQNPVYEQKLSWGVDSTTYYQWEARFAEVAKSPNSTAQDNEAILQEWYAVNQRKIKALEKGLTGQRYKQSHHDSIVVLDLTTGRFKWAYRNQALDTWVSSVGQHNHPVLVDRIDPFVLWQYLGEGGDLDFGTSAIHHQKADLYLGLSKAGNAIALNPDNGKVQWVRFGSYPTPTGGYNYTGTVDDDCLYGVSPNFHAGGFTLTSEVSWDGVADKPKLVPKSPLESAMMVTKPWITNVFTDTYNLLGHGKGVLHRTNVRIPHQLQYITKYKVKTGEIVNVAPLYHQKYLELKKAATPSQLASSNDIIWAGGSDSGKLLGLDTKTLMPFWSHSAYSDIDEVTNDTFLINLTSPVSAGRWIYGPGSGDFFYGGQVRSDGKYFYGFKAVKRCTCD